MHDNSVYDGHWQVQEISFTEPTLYLYTMRYEGNVLEDPKEDSLVGELREYYEDVLPGENRYARYPMNEKVDKTDSVELDTKTLVDNQ